jgi:hypothetical protein
MASPMSYLDAALNRLIDGSIALWESRPVESARIAWSRRRAHARLARQRLRRHALTAPAYRCAEAYWALARPWLRRGSDALHRVATPAGLALGRALHRFLLAQREAWIWLGAQVARLWRRRPAKAEAGGDTEMTGVIRGHGDTLATGAVGDVAAENCIHACAVCAHEAMIVGAGKYDVFGCPECGTALMVIDPKRGITMVSPTPAQPGRVRSATRTLTVKTETSIPSLSGH